MIRQFAIAPIVRELSKNNLLPAIVFRTSRAQCDQDVERSAKNSKLHVDKITQNKLREEIEKIAEKYQIDLELIKSHPQYASLVTTSLGAHHAGQLLTWRLVLEELMSAGMLRVLVATGTVAAGVDFPARSVVVTAHSRRGQDGFEDFSSAELQQMSGRAGRRGKDTVGFCFAAPSMYCDAREISKIAKRPPAPLKSAYFPSASTVLNLLRYRNVDDLRFTVARSLASFSDKEEALNVISQIDKLNSKILEEDREPEIKSLNRRIKVLSKKSKKLEVRQMELLDTSLNGLENLGFLDGDSLSKKGYWAANLCTSMVLELAELIDDGFFNDCTAEELAMRVGSICGDSYRKYLSLEAEIINPKLREKLESVLQKVSSQNMPGQVEGKEVVEDCAATIKIWLSSENWLNFRSLLNLAGAAEGDAARLISQTADHLNQIMRLSESHPEIAKKAMIAKAKLMRPPLSDSLVAL